MVLPAPLGPTIPMRESSWTSRSTSLIEGGFGWVVAEGDVGHLDDGRGKLFDVREAEVDNVFAFWGLKMGHFF